MISRSEIKPMADVSITITIPDAHTTRVQEAFTNLSDSRLTLNNGIMSIEFSIAGKTPTENNIQFAQRFIRTALKQFVRLNEKRTDLEDRYKPAVEAVPLPQESVPEVFT